MLHKLFAMGLSLAFITGHSAIVHADPAKAASKSKVKELSPLEFATRVYNTIETADRLYGFLKIGVSDSEMAYIENLQSKAKGQKLADARAIGNYIWFRGQVKPMKVENLKTGEFSYEGRKFKLEVSRGFRANHEVLGRIVKPAKVALIDWILPSAEASFDPSMFMAGMLTVGGIGMAASSQDTGMQMFGGLMAAVGVYGLISSSDRPMMMAAAPMPMYTNPQSVSCMAGPGGWQQANVMGPYGQMFSVSGYPGQTPYQIAPTYFGPYTYSQYSAGQLFGMCGNPVMLNGFNNVMAPAYAAPAFNTFASQYGRPPMAIMSVRQPASAGGAQPKYYQAADAGVGSAR